MTEIYCEICKYYNEPNYRLTQSRYGYCDKGMIGEYSIKNPTKQPLWCLLKDDPLPYSCRKCNRNKYIKPEICESCDQEIKDTQLYKCELTQNEYSYPLGHVPDYCPLRSENK